MNQVIMANPTTTPTAPKGFPHNLASCCELALRLGSLRCPVCRTTAPGILVWVSERSGDVVAVATPEDARNSYARDGYRADGAALLGVSYLDSDGNHFAFILG